MDGDRDDLRLEDLDDVGGARRRRAPAGDLLGSFEDDISTGFVVLGLTLTTCESYSASEIIGAQTPSRIIHGCSPSPKRASSNAKWNTSLIFQVLFRIPLLCR
jgi:hypothetical protein